MPQVPQNICFKDFVLNYTTFHDHHQCPQTKGGHGVDIFKKCNKPFDYTINTKNLNELPGLIEKLTEKNIQRNIKENIKDIFKLRLKINTRNWKKIWNTNNQKTKKYFR